MDRLREKYGRNAPASTNTPAADTQALAAKYTSNGQTGGGRYRSGGNSLLGQYTQGG